MRLRSGLRRFPRQGLSALPSPAGSAATASQKPCGQGLIGFVAAVLLKPAVVGRLGNPNGAADIGDDLALGDQQLSGLELTDVLFGSVAIRFMVTSPAQPGRMRALIHRGATFEDHVSTNVFSSQPTC